MNISEAHQLNLMESASQHADIMARVHCSLQSWVGCVCKTNLNEFVIRDFHLNFPHLYDLRFLHELSERLI